MFLHHPKIFILLMSFVLRCKPINAHGPLVGGLVLQFGCEKTVSVSQSLGL